MAGRRQHTIPRFLLKGFASKTAGKEVFLWLYRQDTDAIETNIKNVSAEKDFYGKAGELSVDDQITPEYLTLQFDLIHAAPTPTGN
jgi:Protein of unknown function (DUF4238)